MTNHHGKTKSETMLWLEIDKNGELTKKLIALYVFTFFYGIAVHLHFYTFRYWDYSVRRCEIPLLENRFNFDQVLDISTYGVTPDSRWPGSTIYCKYANRNYASLLSETDSNYESIMKKLRDSDVSFNEETCTYKIKDQKREPEVALLSTSFQKIFDERNKTCEDYKYYRNLQNCQFLGIIFAALLLSLLADRYGRRPIFIGCYSCQLLGLIMLFVPLMAFTILGIFLTGIGQYGFLVLYIILIERCARKRRPILGTTVLFCIPLSKIIGATVEVIAYNWKYPVLTSLVILIIIAPLIYWFVDEPPKYLMYSGRVQECIKVLEKYGYRRDSTLSVPKMPEIGTVFLLVRFVHTKLRARHAYTFFLSYLLGIVGIIHDTHAIITNTFGMTSANFIVGSFECIHLGVLCYVICRDLYGRKCVMFTLFMIMTSTHVFVFAQYDRTELFIPILFLLVYSLAHAGLYFLIFYYMELYPTRLRVTCLSLNVLGISAGALTNIGLTTLNSDPLAIILFPEFVASTICWLMSCFASETAGADIPDNLKETPVF